MIYLYVAFDCRKKIFTFWEPTLNRYIYKIILKRCKAHIIV